ncbi:non-specific lipid transfer protein GPI-anchored 13 [Cryptomeria japonica]|uniref:non-specific lipid transfer protein GPI-anchored 13 n=1 Tax=Cryptomeria japonica TaxID=3369 RepID=UPI0025AD7A18|nr:non-specific lipid transfer protein GPI-anchored 13 [Cryptomeria japonica]
MVKPMYIGFVISVLLFCMAYGDLQSDEKECASSLQDLQPCIGFLQGTGKQPTNACCTNVQKVRESNLTCLCLLIKDASDSSSGLSLNQTRLVQMPTLCKVTGKLSDCIGTLKLSPSSPEARIFETASTSSQSSSTGSPPSQTSPPKAESNWSHGVEPCIGFTVLVLLAAFLFTLF